MSLSNDDALEGIEDEPRTVSFHQVLILLAAYFFGGGGGGASTLSEQVQDAVKGKDQRKAAVAIAEGIDHELEQHTAQLVAIRDSFFAAARKHETPADELSVILEQGASAAERVQSAVLDARFRLVETMQANEWQQLCESLANE